MSSLSIAFWSAGIPVAHVSHWLANLLYLLPVLVLAGGIAYQRMADRKARAADLAEGADSGADDAKDE